MNVWLFKSTHTYAHDMAVNNIMSCHQYDRQQQVVFCAPQKVNKGRFGMNVLKYIINFQRGEAQALLQTTFVHMCTSIQRWFVTSTGRVKRL